MRDFIRVASAILFRFTILGALWLGITSLVGLAVGMPFLSTTALIVAGSAAALHTIKSLSDTARRSRADNEIEDHELEQIEWSLLENMEAAFFTALENVFEKIGDLFHKKSHVTKSVSELNDTINTNQSSLPIVESFNQFETSNSKDKNKNEGIDNDR